MTVPKSKSPCRNEKPCHLRPRPGARVIGGGADVTYQIPVIIPARHPERAAVERGARVPAVAPQPQACVREAADPAPSCWRTTTAPTELSELLRQ